MTEYRCTCDDNPRPVRERKWRPNSNLPARTKDDPGVKCLPCFWLLVREAAGLSYPKPKRSAA